MIKENINITFTGGETSFEAEGQIIVPSQVMTATPQDEEVDLEKAPNVLIKLKNEAARGVRSLSSEYKKIKAEFELGDKTYTMNVSLINSSEDYAVFQYCDGMTAEEVTHTFECVATEIVTSYDLISGDDEVGVTHFLYDDVAVPAADISFGTLNYHNITVGEPTANDITLTPKTSFPEMSTGEFTDTLTATYRGKTATVNVVLTITQEEQTGASFTYDGSDQNDPIQIDVELNEFNADDIRINPNLSAPEDMQYEWTMSDTWTPDTLPVLYSNTNDFPIFGQLSDVFLPQTDVDSNHKQFWIDGPTAAGTYLKSYTLTFVYNKELTNIYDENDEHLDDPVAQALDGTSITFWVEYNVTGASS